MARAALIPFQVRHARLVELTAQDLRVYPPIVVLPKQVEVHVVGHGLERKESAVLRSRIAEGSAHALLVRLRLRRSVHDIATV